MVRISAFTTAPMKDEPPFKPYVELWLPEYSDDESGKILLSRPLTAESEIDEAVNGLAGQLEKVRVKAKKDLQKVKRDLNRRTHKGLIVVSCIRKEPECGSEDMKSKAPLAAIVAWMSRLFGVQRAKIEDSRPPRSERLSHPG